MNKSGYSAYAGLGDGVVRKPKTFDEYGRKGLKQYAGVMMEEFLPQLQGQRGIEAYKEMESNDDVIGAILFAIKMLIRQVKWAKRRKTRTQQSLSKAV